MLKISNEVKFGFVAVVTIALIVYGLNFMAGSQVFGPPLVLYASYPNVDGLGKSSPVTINGLRVGKVRTLDLDLKQGIITATLEFDDRLNIPVNSVAEIYSVDLLGSRGIRIFVPDTVEAAAEVFKTNQEITGTLASGLFDQAENLVKNEGASILLEVARLSVQLNEIVSEMRRALNDPSSKANVEGTLYNIKASSENLTSITREVDSLARVITTIAGNASSIVGNFEGNNQNFNEIITNIRKTSDSLVTASTEIKTLMADASTAVGRVENLVSKVDTAGGTVGLLINDRQLYDSLTQTTERINSLLREVNNNPQRFFDDIKIYLIERRPPKSAARKEE
ncbi:MAG: MlaD family protein [Bacteroidia bacterium]|nr:MlaD family protein [Bacteroidia bacterium]